MEFIIDRKFWFQYQNNCSTVLSYDVMKLYFAHSIHHIKTDMRWSLSYLILYYLILFYLILSAVELGICVKSVWCAQQNCCIFFSPPTLTDSWRDLDLEQKTTTWTSGIMATVNTLVDITGTLYLQQISAVWSLQAIVAQISYESCTATGLTHWGRVTHICIGNLTTIGSDNGLSPGRRQAITWTNVGILLIAPLGTNFSEILIEINTFSFKKMHLKMSSGKRRPFVSASMC